MHLKRIFLLIIPVLFALSACEKGTDDEIPSYISIDKIELIPNPDLEGNEGSIKLPNIKDAWVYIDNELIGAFEMPASIPILKSGTHTLRIDAGILVNGIAANRGAYPFYASYVKQIDLVKKETLKITDAKVSYYDNTKFPWKENFETGVSIDSVSGSNTHMQISTDPGIVYEGDGCGAIYLDNDHTTFEGVSSTKFQLPKGGSYVFLELNFRTDNEFYIGLDAIEGDGTTTRSSYLILRSTDNEWKKIYINLSGSVSNALSAVNYKIFFGARKDESHSTASIFVDNIKLVHF